VKKGDYRPKILFCLFYQPDRVGKALTRSFIGCFVIESVNMELYPFSGHYSMEVS
jgi:hypothetical protein